MEWIPIDKNSLDKGELPDNGVRVLISMENEVYMAYRHDDWWFADDLEVYDIKKADAWMPSPKPYKR